MPDKDSAPNYPPKESFQSELPATPPQKADEEMAKRLGELRQELKEIEGEKEEIEAQKGLLDEEEELVNILKGLEPAKRSLALKRIKEVLGDIKGDIGKSKRKFGDAGETDSLMGKFAREINRIKAGEAKL